jgi:hypothetical protein
MPPWWRKIVDGVVQRVQGWHVGVGNVALNHDEEVNVALLVEVAESEGAL